MVTRAIERAQKQVEAQNFAVRKHLLEYDDVMNKQRESVYTLRREILDGVVRVTEDETADTRGYLMATAEDLVDGEVDTYLPKDADPQSWDVGALRREMSELFALDDADFDQVPFDGRAAEVRDGLWERVQAKYAEKERLVPPEILRRVERDLMLQIVDAQW
jgi:preprotein translocase subunit SecA